MRRRADALDTKARRWRNRRGKEAGPQGSHLAARNRGGGAWLAPGDAEYSSVVTHDLVIGGGTVYDGSGSAGVAADGASQGARIARIDARIDADARRTLDARGLAVAPGFIDIKTHSDYTLPINPKAESKVRQGVTTEIIGHCGFSVAPCLPGKTQALADYLSGGAPWLPFRETSFPDYLDSFPAVAVNAGMLVGHNTLRLMAMGLEDRAPTAAELDQMCALLDDGP